MSGDTIAAASALAAKGAGGKAAVIAAAAITAGVAAIGVVSMSGAAMDPAHQGCAEAGALPIQPGADSPDPSRDETAQTIADTAFGMGLPGRAVLIGFMVALQESGMRNIAYGDRDSLGVFQQRPSQGWGTPEQVMNVAHAAKQFFARLSKMAGWQRLGLGEAGQAIQRSAYPDAYDKHETTARQMAARLGIDLERGSEPAEDGAAPGPAEAAGCDVSGGEGPPAGPGLFSAPLKTMSVSSQFGWRLHPITGTRRHHDGVDLKAACGAPIYASAPGVVASTGWAAGYGNRTIVKHADGWYSTYNHQSEIHTAVGDQVAQGDQIGLAGTTGASTGCHLHFEIAQGSPTAVMDPMPLLAGGPAP
jgi:murein DD-endopeptidase MepM/ murein hydrolase activator NlpD